VGGEFGFPPEKELLLSANHPSQPHAPAQEGWKYSVGLSLATLGIVYGDIGTSPLYALRECFHGPHAVLPTHENVLGVLSLIFWAIVITVTLKYCVYLLNADNHGEGGILALMALVRPVVANRRVRWLLVGLGIFGAALLYGDGMITPAVSVLSAVEGLDVATTRFKESVVPITIVILIGLFLVQRRGTGGIGRIFGPVMLVWFASISILGVLGILSQPQVLEAIHPVHAVRFFAANGFHGFLVLGSVFLVATGGEALYADMGHFGPRPIRLDWFSIVMPSLLVNYFGQGALLLTDESVARNPFYHLVPTWGLYPMVVLATMATVIASQALISGAFSLTRQAVQLGYLPRVEIIHTSSHQIGQIYVPQVNWLLMIGTISLVVGFRSSSSLAAAYGIAVTGTMVITAILAHFVTRRLWRWPLWASIGVTVCFLAVDLSFFGANAVKVLDGGWVPLVVALVIYTLMTTWKKGREILAERLSRDALPFVQFVASVQEGMPQRVPGTAIFMARDPDATPTALLHNLKHNKVLHERVILLTVHNAEIPQVTPEERIRISDLGKGFYRIMASYGFTQNPEIPEILRSLREEGLELEIMSTTFFLSRETLIPSKKPGMAIWREKLFAIMTRNALRPTDFFRIPVNRVVELGMQVKV
jgi:KUP system potassium uptake protein